MPNFSVLVVDDEPHVREMLEVALRHSGFNVTAASSGAQALSSVLSDEPDLAILDVMLPDISGLGVARHMRASGFAIPIIFLTAKDEAAEKVAGLDAGGDDYIVKPFSVEELIARIHAVLRRSKPFEDSSILSAGDVSIDEDTRDVRIAGVRVELSPTEYKLLRYFVLNANRVVSKAQILDQVWKYDFGGDANIVESYVSYLRRKLEPHSLDPLIVTKRGFGYMLRAR